MALEPTRIDAEVYNVNVYKRQVYKFPCTHCLCIILTVSLQSKPTNPAYQEEPELNMNGWLKAT